MSLISIIIPCYNYGWILKETLDSVLAQLYPYWECIIIDDGSTDNTRSVVEYYQKQDPRFRYIHQTNAGLSAARNKGLLAARGTYIQFLDADDLIVPTKLQYQVDCLEANRSLDLVFGDVRYFLHSDPNKVSRSLDMQDNEWMKAVPQAGNDLMEALIQGNIMVVNAPLGRRALYEKVGLFDEQLPSMEDWDYWLRCALVGANFYYDSSPNAWAKVRVHSTSMSQNIDRMRAYEIEIRRRLTPILEECGAINAGSINTGLINEAEASQGVIQLREGSILKGIWIFVRLAKRTGRYRYYLGSVPYWGKRRILG